MLIKAKNVTKDYGGHRILDNISVQMNPGEKIGFVGKNGVGKTTFIQLFTGELLPDEGYIETRSHLNIGYLPQQPVFASDEKLYAHLKEVFGDLQALEFELGRLENAMASRGQDKKLNEIMNKYSRIREEFESKGGYQVDRNIRSVLKGLGFNEAQFEKPINHFSGGEKTRALLAKKLLQKPDVLILDEPTNYLDLGGLSWLENYLTNYQQNFIIVTHDRYFLEQTVNVIWELTEEALISYKGNYSAYIEQKRFLEEKQQKEYEKQQAYIRRTQEFIRRNIEGQKTKQAQSRRKQLEKIDVMAKPKKEKSINLTLTADKRSGDRTLSLTNVTKFMQGERLFPPLSCEIKRGDRVGVIGPNGAGKTSLLKLIAGYDAPDTGSIEYGTRVELGYLDQEQELLNPENTLIEELRSEAPLEKQEYIRWILGRFNFTPAQMLEYVSSLSGGEQVRLRLAKLFIRKPNLLLLDEPTNHLDIYGLEALEEAMVDYNGTLILVSHDRYLFDKVATKIIHISREKVDVFSGNYSEYMEKVQKLAEMNKEEKEKVNKKVMKENKKTASPKAEETEKTGEMQIEALMEEIDQLETQKQELEAALGNPELYKDGNKAQETNVSYQEILTKLEEKYQLLEFMIWKEY